MKKHKHKTFEITTKYYQNAPAEIVSASCSECGIEIAELKELLQQRENEVFRIYGNKCPYVVISPTKLVNWVQDTKYLSSEYIDGKTKKINNSPSNEAN